MEPTEITDSFSNDLSNGLIITERAQYYLRNISKWTRFLSITGFVGAAIVALLGVFFTTLMRAIVTSQRNDVVPAPYSTLVSIFCVLTAGFYFFASLNLYQFAAHVKTGLLTKDALQIENGFAKLKSLFKMTGITTTFLLAGYSVIVVIGLVAVIIAAIYSATAGQ